MRLMDLPLRSRIATVVFVVVGWGLFAWTAWYWLLSDRQHVYDEHEDDDPR